MQWGRILAGAAIVALTLLTFASCGPLEFQGHNLLLNRIEIDGGDLTQNMGGMMGGVVPDEMKAASKAEGKSEAQPIFKGGDAWLHYLYIAVVLVAVVLLLAPMRTYAALGIAGFLLTVIFMFSFNNWFKGQGDADAEPNPLGASMSLDWEPGAWLTLLAFGAVAAIGLQYAKGRRKAVD
jgi:hypothetical protein